MINNYYDFKYIKEIWSPLPSILMIFRVIFALIEDGDKTRISNNLRLDWKNGILRKIEDQKKFVEALKVLGKTNLLKKKIGLGKIEIVKNFIRQNEDELSLGYLEDRLGQIGNLSYNLARLIYDVITVCEELHAV